MGETRRTDGGRPREVEGYGPSTVVTRVEGGRTGTGKAEESILRQGRVGGVGWGGSNPLENE